MRRRLALAIVGVTAGAIVLFAIPLAVALRQAYRDEDQIRLERDTVAATRSIDIAPADGADPLEIPRSSDRRVVYSRSGAVLAGVRSTADRTLAREAIRTGRPALADSGGRLVAAVPILANERVTGVLVASRSGAGASHDTHRAWLLLAALAAGVMLAAVAAAFVVARGLSRPLERLAQAATRLGLGDFSVRAPRGGVGEVDAVAEALDVTADRLGDMVARERALSADASHQLRTPLTALRIELEEAELSGGTAAPASALRQVDRLEQTIDTLLAATRRDRHGSAEADLMRIAEELETEWRSQLAADGRRLRLELPSGELRARADQGVVREILQVLVENAARHGRGMVTLAAAGSDAWVRIDVADEGPGFGDDPDAAFERGTSRGGHGIGLALARSLAHAEGGRLSIAAPGPSPVVALVLRRA